MVAADLDSLLYCVEKAVVVEVLMIFANCSKTAQGFEDQVEYQRGYVSSQDYRKPANSSAVSATSQLYCSHLACRRDCCWMEVSMLGFSQYLGMYLMLACLLMILQVCDFGMVADFLLLIEPTTRSFSRDRH